MNYLAHLHLSGADPGVRVGNFIGDHVKGQQFKRYSGPIQTGILLHRYIDDFTDRHPAFRQSSTLFKEGYGKYSGVVCDIVYDHFLAVNWGMYSDMALGAFIKESHRILMHHYFSLPNRVKQFLPFLINSRRLKNYQFIEGVEKTLSIMAGHSTLPDKAYWAIEQLEQNYGQIEDQFHLFFPEIISSTQSFLALNLAQTGPDHTITTG